MSDKVHLITSIAGTVLTLITWMVFLVLLMGEIRPKFTLSRVTIIRPRHKAFIFAFVAAILLLVLITFLWQV